MLKLHLTPNLLPTKCKDVLVEKHGEGLLRNKIVTIYVFSFLTTVFTDVLFSVVSKWEIAFFVVMDSW
jgi:hypothetical protein